MDNVMKAVAKVRSEYGSFEVIEVPMAKSPGDHEVKIRVETVGICGTDLSIYKWTETVAREYHPVFPLIPGHEFAGIVEEVGAGVSHLKVGDKVAINPHISCGICPYCIQNRESICENRPILGCHADGGLTQYLTVRAKNVFVLPANVPIYLGSLAEPLSVTVHALERVQQKSDKAAAIVGVGTVGLLQYIACKAAGYEDIVLFGLDSDQERMELAKRMGAKTVNIEKEDPYIAFERLTGQPKADVVFEVAGTNDSITFAIDLVKTAGKVAMVGIAASYTPIDTTKVVFAEKELIGVRAYNLSTWPKTMEIIGKIVPQLELLVTHRLSLAETNKAVELLLKRQCLKVVIEPNAESLAGREGR
ncbi:zinc-dependent alcohol dehydrogenase [Ammoniphilus resinae]|uniref:Threonine dehydrogenase-like Zn-dependent dehydrogenase n=1 Tax=Ammoniphilus resinae TaxID=861532 RepID=A0ABS4GWC9_9BACL|nr:alcohol dehydrogenase catalytic domain-containing protein [Ammoniphilus resinae]MBP1934556.1 threonine dehydrogenase-like Zn-dependent dehydrogenase [Ammoniphilus resinae]